MLTLIFVDAYENARFLCEQYYNAAPKSDFRVHKRKLLTKIFSTWFIKHSDDCQLFLKVYSLVI